MANKKSVEKSPIIELLACPFCGPVEIVHQWAGNVEIKHKDNACLLHSFTTLHGAAQVAAWNRRMSDSKE